MHGCACVCVSVRALGWAGEQKLQNDLRKLLGDLGLSAAGGAAAAAPVLADDDEAVALEEEDDDDEEEEVQASRRAEREEDDEPAVPTVLAAAPAGPAKPQLTDARIAAERDLVARDLTVQHKKLVRNSSQRLQDGPTSSPSSTRAFSPSSFPMHLRCLSV